MELKEKIQNKRARIAIIGLGYVGLPLAVEFAKAGYPVVGIDLDRAKVDAVNAGRNYIMDVDGQLLRKLVQAGKLAATADYAALRKCDAVHICVPTPFTGTKDPDISYIVSASQGIARHLRKGMLVVLKSTTYPETTTTVVRPILERTGLAAGRDFHLAFSPERIDPGNKLFTTSTTPTVVGGLTPKCGELARLMYHQIIEKIVMVSSPTAAEMTKLLENIFRSVNIALVNELACLCERMDGVDMWEVVDAAATKPYGFMPFYPGPGLGGHCIPIDPYYLAWKAREYDFHTDFIELAAETNEGMPYHVVSKVIEALSDFGIAASKARVLVLGVAFKKDIDDIRSSPAIKVMELLAPKVKALAYNDPYVPSFREHGVAMKSVKLSEKLIRSYDCVLVTTNHSCYDYAAIVRQAKLVVDTRNATKGINSPKIVKIGRK
ncbi:MAG: nucleotide sugar dehydrogenase [Candidatus Edwardsbacteria bacterium]|jgi:UDP-N-acetyl-D-glucosamine dehydrogenase|nr:nucleotide sugar dehydrogenase [Candidatus Edwardsbacteria bacterium]